MMLTTAISGEAALGQSLDPLQSQCWASSGSPLWLRRERNLSVAKDLVKKRLWGGRCQGATRPLVVCIGFDLAAFKTNHQVHDRVPRFSPDAMPWIETCRDRILEFGNAIPHGRNDLGP